MELELDPDVVLFLTGEIRARLVEVADPRFPAATGWIADREWTPPASSPDAAAPAWQVVVRDDGIDDDELTTGEISLGLSVLAGSKEHTVPARDLARLVKAIVKASPRAEAGNPVSKVSSFLGPYPVDEPSTYARQYMVCTMRVTTQQA